jgi:hypothetical protein
VLERETVDVRLSEGHWKVDRQERALGREMEGVQPSEML